MTSQPNCNAKGKADNDFMLLHTTKNLREQVFNEKMRIQLLEKKNIFKKKL